MFYLYASNRLAYANLNGGLFLGYMAIEGITAPQNALALAGDIVAHCCWGSSWSSWSTGSVERRHHDRW